MFCQGVVTLETYLAEVRCVCVCMDKGSVFAVMQNLLSSVNLKILKMQKCAAEFIYIMLRFHRSDLFLSNCGLTSYSLDFV